VVPVTAEEPDEVLGINSRRELAEATRILQERKLDELMASGVTLVDPRRTHVETEVSIGQDTVIDPGVTLLALRGLAGGCGSRPGAWSTEASSRTGWS